VFGFARTVDDAAHDGDFEVFYAWVFMAPFGHFLADVVVYLFGELLVEIAVGAAAARATGDERAKIADAHGLEEELAGFDFTCPGCPWFRCKGNSNSIADALLEENGESGGRCDEAFGSLAGFCKAYVERVVATLGEYLVNFYYVLDVGHFDAEDDFFGWEAGFFGELC